MEERINDIRVRCRLNILRLYPAHRQAQLDDRSDFEAWKAANVTHMNALMAYESADIDEGWPDPNLWERGEISPAAAMLDELEAKKTNLDRAIEEARAKEPPPEIADLLDPDLTTRQNLEKLIEKHTKAKHLEEIARSHGDASGAMRHLKDAERLESGINWNRARLAEVI